MPSNIVRKIIQNSGIDNVGLATIRELKKLIDDIESATGEKFIRMEVGIPGLPPTQIGVDAEIAALKKGVAAIYPDIFGQQELKTEAAKFVKNFLNISVSEEGCIPTVGSVQGGYAAFMVLNRMHEGRDTTLFIDPGFPLQKQQIKVIGQKYETFDIYDFRGDKLGPKIESYLKKGNIGSMIYSNPNNPSWICFTEKELKIIAELANKYDVPVIEDLAYFCMDFRKDYSKPGVPPYQPSVAHYTDKYVLLISSAKAFSYAGQRIALMVVSDALFKTRAPDLKRFFISDQVGKSVVYGAIYSLSAGACHSAQLGFAAILKAANEGKLNFVEAVKEYGEKAKIMKKIFTDNGFRIVYDQDDGEPIADGFYFTIAYPGFSGEKLVEELLYYGVSAIAIVTAGSARIEGLRACVSLVKREDFPILEKRMKQFHADHA